MKIIDEEELKLCTIQANIFAESFTKTYCSSPVFIRRFMYSDFSKRLDSGGFLFEACDINTVFDIINSEFGESSYGKEKFTEQELYWIGYIYRYWCCTYSKTSKQVYKIIKPKDLRSLYYPYHSLDPSQAIVRILEAQNLSEKDLLKRGVEIYRRVLNQKK